MLAGVVLLLVDEGYRVSAVARRSGPLEALVRRAEGLDGEVRPLALDYRDGESLQAALEEATGEWGAIRLAVCWIHSVAPEALWIVAGALASGSGSASDDRAAGGLPGSAPRLLHLLGSAQEDPVRSRPDVDERKERFPGVAWERILLGYRIEDGRSRWLTHDEIVEGVRRAIGEPQERTVIGTVEPWSERP
jgi:hypothetical protein